MELESVLDTITTLFIGTRRNSAKHFPLLPLVFQNAFLALDIPN
jgi:hypothetical protein